MLSKLKLSLIGFYKKNNFTDSIAQHECVNSRNFFSVYEELFFFF